jgi:hypothetical protein
MDSVTGEGLGNRGSITKPGPYRIRPLPLGFLRVPQLSTLPPFAVRLQGVVLIQATLISESADLKLPRRVRRGYAAAQLLG